jgi:hypothetical protein
MGMKGMGVIAGMAAVAVLCAPLSASENSREHKLAVRAYKLGLKDYKRGDYVDALREFNDSEDYESIGGLAENYIGAIYDLGLGVPEDKRKAVEYFVKACNNGNLSGCANAGRMFSGRYQIAADYSKAMDYSIEATKCRDKGYRGMAEDTVGYLAAHGYGTVRDFGVAKKWLRMASADGFGRARTDMGDVLGLESAASNAPERAPKPAGFDSRKSQREDASRKVRVKAAPQADASAVATPSEKVPESSGTAADGGVQASPAAKETPPETEGNEGRAPLGAGALSLVLGGLGLLLAGSAGFWALKRKRRLSPVPKAPSPKAPVPKAPAPPKLRAVEATPHGEAKAPALERERVSPLDMRTLASNARADGLVGGKYRVLREIGRGGMGIVFEAVDIKLDRVVALKKMREELKLNPRDLSRFFKEARTVARLQHPGIVAVYDVLDDPDEPWVVFEYVQGRTIEQFGNEQGRLKPSECLRIMAAAADALQYAHEQGVVHRDFKPGNIMVTKSGQVKVMDFGIARQVKDTVARVSGKDSSGTLAYMSPEQEVGENSPQGDVFAFGVCFYEMLTGELPFMGPNFLVQKREMRYKPASTLVEGLDANFDVFIAACLAPDLGDRLRDFRLVKEKLAGLAG